EDDQQNKNEAKDLRTQIQNRLQRLFLSAIAEHPLQRDLKSPPGKHRQHTDRREHCEGLQYEMNDDLVLYLYLLSPTPVQRDKLLLRSQTIVQDTLDLLLLCLPLQPFHPLPAR